jgi:hypothetical protein
VKSLSGLASLEILQDHEIEISAVGSDADAVLKKISALAAEGFGEALPDGKAIPDPVEVAPQKRPIPFPSRLALRSARLFICKPRSSIFPRAGLRTSLSRSID